MEQVIFWLQQRRIWAGLVGALAVALPWFQVDFVWDIDTLTGLLLTCGTALAMVIKYTGALISGILALWSYVKPKQS